jgi:hypothetical protein
MRTGWVGERNALQRYECGAKMLGVPSSLWRKASSRLLFDIPCFYITTLMVPFRYISLLVLALSLTSWTSQAQKTDLTPMVPVQPLPLPPLTLGKDVPLRRSTPTNRPPAPPTAAVVPRQPGPLILLNSRVITGLGGLDAINPQDIKKIDVYKNADYPGHSTPAQWRSLAANGILDLTLTKKLRVKSQSLAQLGRYLKAKGQISYALNGLPTASGKLRIATEAIEEIKLVRTATSTTVDVWFLQVSSKPSPPRPPGTIMIRGTASR